MARDPLRGTQRERMAATSARKEPERPSRLRIFLRRRRSLARPVLWGALGLGAAAAILLLVRAVDPAGRVRDIAGSLGGLWEGAGLRVGLVILEGREHTPRDLVVSALGVSRGDPILDFSPEAARRRLETISWVARAEVSRQLPSTILVRIEERRPFAIWQHNGRFAIIDRGGQVMATEHLGQFETLPLLVGAGAETAGASLYDELRRHQAIRERVQALIRIQERRWNLRLHNGTDVLLPAGAERAALERLAELQQEARLLDRPLAAIDMRLPDRLVLRPSREEQPAEAPAPQNARTARRG
jgi:cell division protein FtsQ